MSREEPESLTTEYLVFTSRIPRFQDSEEYLPKGFHVLAVKSLDDLYSDFGEETSLSREEFLKGLEELPLRLEYEDGVVVYIEHILTYRNVPKFRSVNEIMSAIFCACAANGLMKGRNIRRGPMMMEVLTTPDGILNPEEFNWDALPKLITFLVEMISIPAHLDLTDNLKVKERVKKVKK